MARLIDKDALVAEIEKLVNNHDKALDYEAALEDMRNFIDTLEVKDLQEEPNAKFKVGQTITDPTDSTFTFHINKIEDRRYIEKEDEWVLGKEADANYELVEEPVSIWHDSNKEQPNFASTVAIWNPKYKNGEIISRCTKVYPDRIWAYIDDLLKM